MNAAAKAAHKVIDKRWKHALVASAAFAITYGLASLAIDSGRLLAYFGTLLFLIIGVQHLIWAIKKGYAG